VIFVIKISIAVPLDLVFVNTLQ